MRDKMVKKQNILFICKYNIFRSKIAEAYFNKINKNKNLNAKSAGILLNGPPLYDKEIKALKKLKIEFKQKSNKLNKKLLDWADIIVILGKDVPRKGIKTKGIIYLWEIKDTKKEDKKIKIMNNLSEIRKKVIKLNQSLRK
jgi:protein-tyrosine-phosphatase